MSSEPPKGGLAGLRAKIDEIDDRILELIDARAHAVSAAIEEKRRSGLPMHDPEREQTVLNRLEQVQRERRGARFPVEGVRPVFREVLSACFSILDRLEVAFLGPAGTFSHAAAQAAFGLAAHYVPVATIPGVFDAVSRGAANYGVVPIENSTEGGVGFTLDCLIDTELLIRREFVLDVNLCLLGQHAELGRIERVFSHPQPLAQCRSWLARNLPNAQLIVSHSTSAAAREALADTGAAAVASRLAAEIHGLKLIRESIQDRPDNSTRFVVIAKTDAPATHDDKTSVLFGTPDERGALKRVLETFYEEGLNLTRIESRPRPGAQRWQYVFFTDIEGHREDPAFIRALARLEQQCAFVKVLGSYPRAR